MTADDFRRPVAYSAGSVRNEVVHMMNIEERWAAAWHVLNHGTDHRAQVMIILALLGVTTFPQDYALNTQGKL